MYMPPPSFAAGEAQANAEAYTDAQLAAIVNGAPAGLDTLGEIATAIDDDPGFAASLAAAYLSVGQTRVDVQGKYGGDLAAAFAAEGSGKAYRLGNGAALALASELDLGAHTALIGDSKALASIAPTAGIAGYAIRLGDGGKIEGVTLDMASAPAKVAVDFAGSADAEAHSVKVTNATSGGGTGFQLGYVTAATRPVLINCSTDSCYYGILANFGTTDALIVGGAHTNGKASTTYEGSLYLPNAVRARVQGVKVDGAAGHGCFIDGGKALYHEFVGCIFSNNGTAGNDHDGVDIANSAGNAYVNFVGCDFFSNIACGALVSGGNVTDVSFVACRAIGNNVGQRPGGNGFEIGGNDCKLIGSTAAGQVGAAGNNAHGVYVGGVRVTVADCKIHDNWSDGIRCADGSVGFKLRGNTIYNNSQSGVGNNWAINAFATSALSITDFEISGNHCYDTQATKTQEGITVGIAGANIDYGVIVGNISRATENHSTGLSNSAGAGTQVANNVT